jgi:hypothetical protein
VTAVFSFNNLNNSVEYIMDHIIDLLLVRMNLLANHTRSEIIVCLIYIYIYIIDLLHVRMN